MRKEIAKKYVTDNGCTSFNLVFEDIPDSYINQPLYAKAYVCINGMYFNSNVITGSFSEIANLVLADDEIDTNTAKTTATKTTATTKKATQSATDKDGWITKWY